MENSVIEEWIQKNTFKCPALNARISLKQCEEIRSRPSFDDYIKGLVPLPKRKTIKSFRPKECDKCKIWEEFAMAKEKDKRVCSVCGAKFEPYKSGCVVITTLCKKCLKQTRINGLKCKSIKINPQKLKQILQKYGLLSILINKAEKSVREIEEQIVYEIKRSLLIDAGDTDFNKDKEVKDEVYSKEKRFTKIA